MKGQVRGQIAVETLMAVIILLGMLLVITFVSLQQSNQANALKSNEEKETLCNHLASVIESVGNSNAQVNVRVLVTQPVWIDKSSINFSPDRNNFSCYFFADINGLSGSTMRALGIGSYTVRRNSARQVEIIPYCEPRRCGVPGSTGYQCGTFLDGCGGEIYCGTKLCDPARCGDWDDGCNRGTTITCNCPSVWNCDYGSKYCVPP